ncbi:glycoside hydrolase family 88 protein [Motilibacter peucedani]|uniref:glycoside hydrolase family 88 protein n=1 Tax=Motilibacter peucedani TaxID=598650 RepID=UPI001E499D4E|nr:glycoside hydrolase family 88 protein [Motilibacter peucedani]
MSRRTVLRSGAALAAAPLVGRVRPAAVPAVLPSRRSVLAAVRLVNDAWLAAHPRPGDNRWAHATYVDGCLAAYAVTRERRYLAYAERWAEAADYRLHGGPRTRDADDMCAGQAYYALHTLAPDPAKLASVDSAVLRMAHRSGPGSDDDWWWVDALHMAMPVFCRVARHTGDPTVLPAMWRLYSDAKHRRGLYDRSSELWFRDGRFVPPAGLRSPHGAPVFWSRGNGWAFAAHAKTLSILPGHSPHRREYLNNLQALARSTARTQRADGFWGVDLADPDDHPGPETSGTALFVHSLAHGVRAGLLDRATCLPVAVRAWNAMVATAVHSDGFLGYVQGVGDSPSSSQPVTRDTTADFAVGAFLRAGSALARLAR